MNSSVTCQPFPKTSLLELTDMSHIHLVNDPLCNRDLIELSSQDFFAVLME